MKFADKEFIESFLDELAKEETALELADIAFAEANARQMVASEKYSAVRDMVIKRIGTSPYGSDSVPYWQTAVSKANLRSPGRHRFTKMAMGDAVVAALKEVKEPITLDEITERLITGGSNSVVFGSINKRVVNAALMKTAGIIKTEDGKYTYINPEDLPFKEEEEDLPFKEKGVVH